MDTTTIVNQIFLVRAAQSIARRSIRDLDEANRVGRQIVSFALENWEPVTFDYGRDGADDLKIIERLARDILELRAEVSAFMQGSHALHYKMPAC